MYADDTVLFSTSPTELRQKLELVIDWCTNNLLTINLKKTKWMAVGSQRSTRDLQLIIIIKDCYVKEYKYLGFTIDTNLDYQLQRQNLFGKVQNYLVRY